MNKIQRIRLVGRRLLVFLLLWLALSGGVWRDPVLAGIGIVAAAAVSLWAWPVRPLRIVWRRLPGLAVFFIWASFRGGFDIAWRAISPNMPLRPGRLDFKTNLPAEESRVFLVWMISLMPGTAGLDLREDGTIVVHVVDTSVYVEKDLRRVEEKVAGFIIGRES